MNKNIVIAVLLGVFAAAATLLSNPSPLTAESAVGYIAVVALLGMAAVDYGIGWRRFGGRS